ncbi:phage terminase small subunit [Novosphingobium colocasiae]|uniref:Phage terminase/endonuclease subunit n=1 Tax=Novosphingobium colocasiae TaxID=1256513 RepID=A0A918UFR3_9SPHN|nr:phage terminase small subunit [Novosphingobium colocasiae]GGZ02766.1 phage terminase/endonuclease subunit [Novosphingobium colocasiae]
MFSPALRHRQRVLAQLAGEAVAGDGPQAAPPPPAADTAAGQEYAALRVLLHDNLRTLADVQSIETRNPMKAQMAKAFVPWVEGALAAGDAGEAAQDEILVTQMIWAIDYRDIDLALQIGAHVLKFALTLPEPYKRTPACFLAEDLATIALASAEQVTLEQLLRVATLTADFDMPDQARAKLHKAIARAYDRKAEAFDPADENAPAGGKGAYLTEAGTHYARAIALWKDVGVKKDIDRIERQLKAMAAAESNDGN